MIEQHVVLDGRTYAVIGVMPASFQFPDAQTRFWVPFVETDFARIAGAPVALDAGSFIAVAVFFGFVATIASYLPARRATSVDPLVALRCE